MTSPNGWVHLYSKMTEWEWYDDTNVFRVFMHLLLTANWKPTKWHGVEVLSGQTITGRKELAKKLRISEQSVRTSLNKLKSTNEITIKTTPNYSLVTLNNWKKYQQPTNKSTNDQPTINQRSTTPKDSKTLRHKDIPTPSELGGAVDKSGDSPAGETPPLKEPASPRKTTDLTKLVEHFFAVKGWEPKGPEFRRHLRAAKDLLAVCDGSLDLAKAKVEAIRLWAERKELSWSLDTILKRWHELEPSTARDPERKKRASIDGDRAYQNERGDWKIIPRDGGPHLDYVGPLSAIRYE